MCIRDSGKTVRFSSPTQFMAQRKSTIEEAYPGDIVGLPDNGIFKIGDTLTEGEDLHFRGLPSFSPELFKYIENDDPKMCIRDSNSDGERLVQAQRLAERLEACILLKGHYSALCLPNGHVLFNGTGNSGMATAGSGDVLTGIITALLARGYNRVNACAVGMYLHGLAGDLAAKDVGKESLVATDIITYLPKAFMQLEE